MVSNSNPMAPALRRLAPFLLGRVRRGIVGSSRYAQKLRDQIRSAAADPQATAVLISGEPGLEKDNVAALIHYGSPARKQLLVRLNGAVLRSDGAELFAPGADGTTLMGAVGCGALLIDQVDLVDPALLPRLRELALHRRWQGPDGVEHAFNGRLFLTSETHLDGSRQSASRSGCRPCGCVARTSANGCAMACGRRPRASVGVRLPR